MKKELINNIYLQKLITLKCNKFDFDDITDKEIENIRELNIHGKLINGQNTGIDLSQNIELFEGLETLSISDFTITQEVIEKLKLLKKLRELEIVDCDFYETDFSEILRKIPVKFVGCKGLPFKLQGQRIVNIEGCDIDMNNISLDDVEELRLISCFIRNAKDIEKAEKLRAVNLNGSILTSVNNEKIDNIIVPEGCSYSHIDDVTQVYDGIIEMER